MMHRGDIIQLGKDFLPIVKQSNLYKCKRITLWFTGILCFSMTYFLTFYGGYAYCKDHYHVNSSMN